MAGSLCRAVSADSDSNKLIKQFQNWIFSIADCKNSKWILNIFVKVKYLKTNDNSNCDHIESGHFFR
jgi:hypothetical protein